MKNQFSCYQNHFMIFILAFLLAVPLGQAQSEKQDTEALDSQPTEESDLVELDSSEAVADPLEPTTAADHSLLEEARSYQDAGELVKAKESYKALLAEDGISEDVKEAAESELESLNFKLLFSPTETEGSVIRTVKSGDNLYNIAKEYGTTVGLIQKVNDLKGDLIKPGLKLKVVKAQFSIEIDKSENMLKLLADGEPLKTYRVGTGANNSTPVGQFTITNKLENPTWYKAGAVVPPDSPDNILGTRWLGFSLKGYGIHGTTLPESIGKQESSGCIRMLNQDVEELYSIVPTGASVTVVD
ncbi:MAG: L,D-transpeptidase family protein [Candidatus Omnitrophica bacterium]|nr:L,D-transpeptidase family protein [Candidatus Omnitrophota bacterium]